MKDHFGSILQAHQDVFQKTFTPSQVEILEKIVHEIIGALRAGHKLLICGNGGSASDAQHIAAEFVGRFEKERMSLPAIALSADTSALTAIGNDFGFGRVFSRQVEGLGKTGDLLIAISTSGRSANVLEAAAQAKRQGLRVIGFTGKDGGPLKDAVDLCFIAKSSKTTHIQEMHITALHGICEAVETILFG
ncbi:MAG: D-sedoheptulose 7-phosphate isomerase [Candidatus Omnitrophica bacterium]|nr:D-sedoheptulose 7-phosphate isomerase [Candidatus Omnitrophota bacterium]